MQDEIVGREMKKDEYDTLSEDQKAKLNELQEETEKMRK
jgi:hypothetical protein